MKRTNDRLRLPFARRHAAIRLFIACVVTSIVPIASLAAEAPTKPDAKTESAPTSSAEARGAALLSRNDLAGAEAAFKEALASSPGAPGPLIGLADIELRRHQPEQARALVEQALSAGPADANVYAKAGRLYDVIGDHALAEANFTKAIELDQRNVPAHIGLGALYAGVLDRTADAIAHYETAIRLQPRNGIAYFGLGQTYAKLGKFKEAETNLRTAAGLSRGNPEPYHALGVLYGREKRFTESVAAFDLALRINSEYVPALVDRATVLSQLGRDHQAINDLQLAVQTQPTNAATQVKLALLYHRTGRRGDAKATLLQAIKYDSQLAVAYNLLGWIAAETKTDLDNALVWSKRAIELDPSEAGFVDTLGWVYRARGELPLAIPPLEQAAATDPPKADFYYHLGVVYAESGRSVDAKAALARALEIDANFADASDARKRLATLTK